MIIFKSCRGARRALRKIGLSIRYRPVEDIKEPDAIAEDREYDTIASYVMQERTYLGDRGTRVSDVIVRIDQDKFAILEYRGVAYRARQIDFVPMYLIERPDGIRRWVPKEEMVKWIRRQVRIGVAKRVR